VTTEAGAETAVRLSGVIAVPDGSAVIRAQVTGTPGEQLGQRLAHLLLARGGAALLGPTLHEVTDPGLPLHHGSARPKPC
jgi:hypothetical protein